MEIKNILEESLEINLNDYKENDALLKCPTWDSIGILTIIANCKQKYNLELDGKLLNKFITFKELISYIEALIK
jgi:acyl carrier protein